MTTQRLGPGCYYLYSPRQSFLGSLSFGSKDKEATSRIGALIKSADKQCSPGPGSEALACGTFNPAPSTYSMGAGAAVVVQPGLFDAAGDVLRVQPSVAYDPNRNLICVFNGYLSNVDELAERYSGALDDSPRGSGSPTGVLPAGDQRQWAAELLLRAYVKNRSGDLLVLLSELQGQYAFSICDGEKRCAFAARDSSGREALYYEIDDDGAVSLSNAPLAVPADAGFVQWAELPAGHYISGRSPKLGQFALTPEQVSLREAYESLAEEFEGASPRGGPAYSSEGARSGSAELDVFSPMLYDR